MRELIVGGDRVPYTGAPVTNFRQRPELKLIMGEDMRPRRTRWVRGICIHTTKGLWPQKVLGGRGPSTDLDHRIARLWSTDHRNAGAHLSVDWDGAVCCHADLLLHAAYHAPAVNEVSIGIELYQGPEGQLYSWQLEVCVTLVTRLTELFGIQRQMPLLVSRGPLERIARGAKDFVGVYGHRHVGNRGPGDPGDAIFEALAEAGYRQFNVAGLEDQVYWAGVQTSLGLRPDGIPGPITCDALREKGHAYGVKTDLS